MLDSFAIRVSDYVIARGDRLRDDLQPVAPVMIAVLAEVAREAERAFVSVAVMRAVDVLGAVASVGVELPAMAFDHARTVLSATPTRRDDERVAHHWARGFAALALDHPSVYRGVVGLAGAPSVPFHPAETFGPNMHGLLTHLAGAVESGAPVEACLPAWEGFVTHYEALDTASSASSQCLFWAGWILHCRLAGQPVGTLAQWLHETLYRAAGVNP